MGGSVRTFRGEVCRPAHPPMHADPAWSAGTSRRGACPSRRSPLCVMTSDLSGERWGLALGTSGVPRSFRSWWASAPPLPWTQPGGQLRRGHNAGAPRGGRRGPCSGCSCLRWANSRCRRSAFFLGIMWLVPAMAFLIMASGRWVFRSMQDRRRRADQPPATPVPSMAPGMSGTKLPCSLTAPRIRPTRCRIHR